MQRVWVGGHELVVLDAAAIEAALPMPECIAAVEEAFRALGEGGSPKPGMLGIEGPDGSYHVKAAAWPAAGYFVAKINSNYPSNPARGLPTIQGLALLYEISCGRPVALLDSGELTARRTGAATGVAVKHLAMEGPVTVTIYGCGRQASAQLEAVAAVRVVDSVYAFDVDASAADRLAAVLRSSMPIRAVSGDEVRACTRRSDVVITCTSSRQSFLGANDVGAGCLVAAVGADNPHKQELEPALMARAQVVVDVLEQCASGGDLHHALEAGAMRLADVYAELGEIVAGSKAARVSADDVIVFDSTGMALQDLVAARAALMHAGM